MNSCRADAIRLNASWLMRIISMLASMFPSVNTLMSAPAEKNFRLALCTTTTRTPGDAIAESTAEENSVMNALSYELAGGWSSVMKPSAPSVV